jgi:hypothetical protein
MKERLTRVARVLAVLMVVGTAFFALTWRPSTHSAAAQPAFCRKAAPYWTLRFPQLPGEWCSPRARAELRQERRHFVIVERKDRQRMAIAAREARRRRAAHSKMT